MGFEDWFSCACNNPEEEEPRLERDYDTKKTPLYNAIENLQWATVNYYIKTGYWKNNFFPDPVKPAVQAKTWMVRYEDNLQDETITKTTICLPKDRTENKVWKQLPMHAAIIYNAPAIIIQKLLRLYPMAVRCTDGRGNLPIHLAFRHNSNDAVLALLLQEYPEGMNCREANGLLPAECATETPCPQPLRGALLKTSLSKEEVDRNYISERVKEERFYFDDRPVTPHQGNLSTRNRPQDDNEQQIDALNQQIENLRNSVDRVMSKTTGTTPTHSDGHQGLIQQVPSLVGNPSLVEEAKPDSKKQLSPTALESLQAMVSRTLAGPSAAVQLSPKGVEDSEPLQPINLITDQQGLGISSVPSLFENPSHTPSHQVLPLQPKSTSTSNILNPLSPRLQSQQADLTSPRALTRNLSYTSMQNQHAQHQQQLQLLQAKQQEVNLSLRDTATFEEQQMQLDAEVQRMEDKMLQMEFAMKQMHKREKTVRRELAMTLQEVKHWKEQAKRAATEEEKNRILTEMLHELVPSSATPRATPRKNNKTPTSQVSRFSSFSERPTPKADPIEDEPRHRPTNTRKTQSEMYRSDRKTPQSRQYHEDGRNDTMGNYRDYPPSSKRHSDVGVYNIGAIETQYDRPRRGKDNGSGYGDEAPALPLRRIQSEYYGRQSRPSELPDENAAYNHAGYLAHNMDGRRKSERGARRTMEPNAMSGNRVMNRGGRGYAEPQGPHVDHDSFALDDPVIEQQFSNSLVEKITSLQSQQENETRKSRNYRRAEKMVEQQRRRRDTSSRDPDEEITVRRATPEAMRKGPLKKHAQYYRHAKKANRKRISEMDETSNPSATSQSSSASGIDYYVIE